jgi:RNA polymerase-binding transcription factor DksA
MTPVEDSEHLIDPLDVATRSAQKMNDAAIQHRRSKLVRKRNPVKDKKPDGTWPKGAWPEPDCNECGDPIGIPRLEVTGSDLCVHCATVQEKARGDYRY